MRTTTMGKVKAAVLAAAALLAASSPPGVAEAARAPPAVQCSVCKHVVSAIEQGIADTKETHTVQVAFRMDEKVRVPYARSEYRLYEVVEPICNKLRHGHAVRGGTRLARTADHTGDPAALDSSRKAVKEIQRACARVLDDFQEDVVLAFHRTVENPFAHVCEELTGSCGEGEAARLAEQEEADRAADAEHAAQEAAKEAARQAEEEKTKAEAEAKEEVNIKAKEDEEADAAADAAKDDL